MKPEAFEEIRSVFLQAADMPVADRAAWLDRVCDGRPELRAEVERLLAEDEGDDGLSFTPPGGVERPYSTTHAGGQPERIGPYRILRVLGVGGMGVVYEAEQESPRRHVALKVLRPGMATRRLSRRLEFEAELLARLQHPGIAQIYEAGTADTGQGTQPYFAMELVDGQPLTEYARRLDLDVTARLEMFTRICDAVEYAHQRGVIHRDLKPGNILVTTDGNPKILDFGVARSTDADLRTTTLQTDAGQLIGTIAYMSPEQCSGNAHDLDTRSDVYALGVLLCELLTGRLPYDTANMTIPKAIQVIQEASPTLHRTVSGPVANDLITIARKAMEKEPDRRYQSASAFADDIRRFSRQEPISARPPSAIYRFRKFAARNKIPVALTALLFGAVTTAAVVTGFLSFRLAGERDAALVARQEEGRAHDSAEQVVEFLISLFKEADPGRAGNKETTLRDVVDTGADRIQKELADQPLVRARLLGVLGSVYSKLGDFTKATELLEEAVRIRRSQADPDDLGVAESLITLANHLLHVERSDEAYDLVKEVFQIRSAHFDPPHESIAESLEFLGSNRYYANDFPGAIEHFRQSLSMYIELFGLDDLNVARAQSNLGMALRFAGQVAEAEPLLRQSLTTRKAKLGNHVDVRLAMENLAHCLFAKSDYEGAEKLLGEELAMAREVFHAHHPSLAWHIFNYAALIQKNHGNELAEPLYREALAIRKHALGDQHVDVAHTLQRLGRIRFKAGDFTEAESFLAEAVAIFRLRLGDRSPLLAKTLQHLAAVYREAGRFDDAESLLLESWRIVSARDGEDSPNAAKVAKLLVALYESAGRQQDAAQWKQRNAAMDISRGR